MMRHRLIAAVAACLLVTASLPASALASGPLDQAYEPQTLVGGWGSAGFAQTFTAGRSGLLDAVQFMTEGAMAGSRDVTVEIRAGDPSGVLLASATASIPAWPAWSAWIEVQLPTPAAVVTGEIYAIVLPPLPANTHLLMLDGACASWLTGSQPTYAAGQSWVGFYEGSGPRWYPYADWVPDCDFFFRTYVEPATPGQLITALLGRVQSYDLHKGITNALSSQLKAAQRDLAHGETALACEDLTDFETTVQAQAGKKVPLTVAQGLVQSALWIKSLIGC